MLDDINQKIVDAIRNGQDSKYIDLVYSNFLKKANKIVYDGGGRKEDAKDLLHDTLLSFFKYVKDCNYAPTIDVEAFLYVSAKNKWINKAVRDKKIEYIEAYKEGGLQEVSPLINIFSKERAEAVTQILNNLGDRCKQLLQLIYYEDKTMKEICEIMNYGSADAAKTKHYKCKQRMEDVINENSHYKLLLQQL